MCSRDLPNMYALSPWASGIHIRQSLVPMLQLLHVTGFTKTIPIGTRNEIQFIADY